MMDEAGIGGFFMHARGGLQTTYMGDEWFENVTASVDEGHKRGMRPWAYDENGWPSGFGNGLVNGLGIAYQQKYLRMEDENPRFPEMVFPGALFLRKNIRCGMEKIAMSIWKSCFWKSVIIKRPV